jgi:hypothetical protein
MIHLLLWLACATHTSPAPAAEPPPVSGCDCCNWGITGAPPTRQVEVPPLPESCVAFLESAGEDWCWQQCPTPM